MIRWEEAPSGDWLGYSGEAQVASATKSDDKRWEWEVSGAGKPKGWRNSGHRTNELDARRAADAYWDKWLTLAALRPDLGRLAETSVRKEPLRASKPARSAPADPAAGAADRSSLELEAANGRIEDLQRRLERAEARAGKAEERATAAEARAEEAEQAASARVARLKAALGE